MSQFMGSARVHGGSGGWAKAVAETVRIPNRGQNAKIRRGRVHAKPFGRKPV